MWHWYPLRALPQHDDADHYDNENSDAGDGNEEAGSLSEIRRLHFPNPHVILQNKQAFHLCENIIWLPKYFGFFFCLFFFEILASIITARKPKNLREGDVFSSVYLSFCRLGARVPM